jgi:hypothetical protein
MENVIETARSGRAACRTCKEKIAKGELRFGVAYKSRYDEGDKFSFAWHHLPCAAKAQPDKLGPTLAAYQGEVSNRAELEKLIAEAPPKKVKEKRSYPYAERAPTARSKCIGCGDLIGKGDFRFVVEREVDAGSFVAMASGNVHLKCIGGFLDSIDWEAIAKNSKLEETDLTSLQKEYGAL